MHVKKNDIVEILSGKDKGKKGKILKSLPREMKVVVEGVNVRKIHQKKKRSEGKGQIIEKSMPIYASTVKLSK